MIRGAITVAVLVAAFIGLARAGAVHGEMCLSQVGCVHAAKHDAAFHAPHAVSRERKKRVRTRLVVTPPG